MKKIAVFFPGIGYHCDKPLLYYSRKLAQEAGFDCIPLSYRCDLTNLRGNAEKMRAAGLELYAQAETALHGISWETYGGILFVSKSVGTAIAAAYIREHRLKCRNVFYTPVALTFAENPRNGIAFTGTADPWVETEIVRDGCAAAGIPLTVIENGNHSLETGAALADMGILSRVMGETGRYIQQETQP